MRGRVRWLHREEKVRQVVARSRGGPPCIGPPPDRVAIALALTIAALGCTESPTVVTQRRIPPPRLSTTSQERPRHSDEYLAQVADRVPGFAGFYMRDGTLVLRVKDPSARAPDVAALRQTLREDPDIARFRGVPGLLEDGPVVVEPSPYDARELWDFRLRILEQAFTEGMHQLDQDESQGLIQIGVDASADVGAIRARLSGAGIPHEAVAIEVKERARRLTTRRDSLRPVPGGVQVEVQNGYRCTMTVNAFMSVSGEWAFFTCSHCTSEFGAAYGEAAYQPVQGTGTIIGWEIVDPALLEPGTAVCPEYVVGCRYSDAALFVYESASYPDSMTIARTWGWSLGLPWSITINPNHPRFAVNGVVEYLPQGLEIHKIGKETGWTKGEVVTETCVDLLADDGIMTLCSWVADLESKPGDSGSPVFTWDGSSWTVGLVGNLWGGAEGYSFFSPWLYIDLEVGGELGEILIIEY
jgi:hypothetical protein